MPLTYLVFLSFTVYRLTRLVVEDTIFDKPRMTAVMKLTQGKKPRWVKDKIGYMITCPYCASFWVTIPVWLLAWVTLGMPWPALMFFATWTGALVVWSVVEK